ncbi:MAG: glutaredoxin family protein [Gammaproteobacteria bacterium]|nr:glutaredoxin family protein [Gammaproteobacteria bacterium]
MTALKLYVREGCHLCEEMLNDLQALLQDREVLLELIDVDHSPVRLREYDSRVPVLESLEGDCLSEYLLDESLVIRYLDGH